MRLYLDCYVGMLVSDLTGLKVCGTLICKIEVKYGVQQGSVNGPVIFQMYKASLGDNRIRIGNNKPMIGVSYI